MLPPHHIGLLQTLLIGFLVVMVNAEDDMTAVSWNKYLYIFFWNKSQMLGLFNKPVIFVMHDLVLFNNAKLFFVRLLN